jgi:UDP:flavonoid glycosyltransferase YjiC (YdhE family)
MRILFTFAGGTGHFLPLASVALTAERAGHVVAFAGQKGMIPTVEAAGFTAFASGGASLLATAERAPLLKVDVQREARAVRESYARRIAGERADAILTVCGEWQPDVLVRDEMDFGAVVAAERLGLPHATILCIASGSFVPNSLVLEPLNELRAEHDLLPDPELTMLSRYLVLSPFPPSFRDPAFRPPPTTHAYRAEAPDISTDDAAPFCFEGLSDAPIVYLTFGTIFNLESGDLFERALAGLRELPARIVVTVGRELDPESLGPQPQNVYVRRYIPQSRLLPHCSLVVSHGGSGSVISALRHGLPMVLLPMGADQPLNAERAEQLGVAKMLDAVDATPATLREAAATVMSDPTYRKNAERIRDEIDALPGPEYAVALLERLVREKSALLGQ